jgi:soluble lytic murein transglycosylase
VSHLEQLQDVGTDLQFISPRPYQMMHSEQPHRLVNWYIEETNYLIARQCKLYPDTFRGLCGLPQHPNGAPLDDAVRELTLPLRHEDVIRQQAADKRLDPALISAVIYEESKFIDRTSTAGAKGLMQIVPGTALFIARRSGGTEFELRDLAEPQINIAYGSWYLRHLLDRYGGNEELAVAAYNAGMGNVDRWVARAGGPESFELERDVPFPETREYVRGVVQHRDEYREHYADELGLD